MDKPVSAGFAKEKADLLVDLAFQILRISELDLLENSFQLSLNVSFGNRQHAIKIGEDPYVYNVP